MIDLDALAEHAIKLKSRKRFDWRSIAFDKQIRAIEDPHRLKAFFTTRRAGKTYADAIYLLKECLENPKSICLFVGLTRLSAKANVWGPCFKDIDVKCDLGLKFNETELTIKTPNDSVIYIAGVDVDETERRKLFGRKYRLVVIDEAALFGIDLRHLINIVIGPALTDQRGTLVLSGMASDITRGIFYDITTRKEQGWSLHTWSAYDNPHMAQQWTERIEFVKINQPALYETPSFRQAYFIEWVVDEDKLVYKFSEQLNVYDELPPVSPTGWTYILGVDTGWEDDNAFVLCGFHEHSPQLFVIKTFNKPKMTFDQVTVKIQEFMNDPHHPPSKIIIDGANKQGVESMRSRSSIPFEFADKRGKEDFIEMLNGDFVQSKIKINQSCKTLISELKALIWKTNGEAIIYPRKEDPRLPNHLCDAFLYAWRNGYHYHSAPPEEKVIYGSRQWYEKQAKDIWDKERERLEKVEHLGQEEISWPQEDYTWGDEGGF